MKYMHTNIVARDWKRIADFYIAVFGCTIKPPERNYSGYWLDQATGLTGAALKGVHLLLPGHGESGPTLEIFSYEEMVEKPSVLANHTGLTHIAFEVEDVDEVFELAKKHGGSGLGEVTEKEIEGVGVLKLIYFRDPEDNIIEILSWTK